MNQSVLKLKYWITFALLCCLLIPVHGQFYYGLRQDFGKNRVQFNEFDWVFYRFEQFDIYFYRGNDELAEQVARMAHEELPQIEDILDAPLDDRVQILVFNNLSDLKQSNVNSNADEDYNTGGVTRISGRRLFVYFNGNFEDLKTGLRSGLTEVVLSNMIYGNFTQSIRNSALLNLPEWYTEGLISYIGDPNNPEIENFIRDSYLNKKYKNINALVGVDAQYAGHSMWSYIVDVYGEKVVKNVVYMAIVNRNIESGFLYILGKNLDEIDDGWKEYLKQKYGESESMAKYPDKAFIKGRKGERITQMAGSHDGQHIAYVKQRFSRYKLFIYDFEKGKKKRLLTDGYRIAQNADYSYPLLAWHPNGKILAVVTEEGGFTYLAFYNLEDKEWEKKKFFKFDKILSFQYSRDGKKFLLSATKNGQSDIFIYSILNTKIEQLTDDPYSDINPTFIQGNNRVVWASDRPSNLLIRNEKVMNPSGGDFDLFAMKAAEPEMDTTSILQMTNSPDIDEKFPKRYAPGFVAFLSNRDNIYNRHLIQVDSNISFVDTITHYEYTFREYSISNYERGLLDHIYQPDRDMKLDLTYMDGRYRLFESPFETPEDLYLATLAVNPAALKNATQTERDDSIVSAITSSDVPLYYPGINPRDFEINIYDYKFEDADGKEIREGQQKPSDDDDIAEILPTQVSATEELPVEEEEIEIPPKRNYFLSFFQDDFTVRFDNMFDNPQYQRFTGFVSGDLLNAGFNMQFKVGVMDLMHDYRIIAGMRTNFQPLAGTSLTPNSTFLVGLGDYKNRLDKEYIYTRNSQVLINANANDYTRIITNQFAVKGTWPLNPVASFRGVVGYRLDQTIELSRDANSLNTPTLYQDYVMAKAAYVYDNTRKIGLNLYDGLRVKFFTEYYHNLYTKPSGMHTAGMDLRNYTRLHRNLVWANRFATGTSFGPEKLIYIMGGVDNQFAPKFEPTTPIATENNYVFQTLVTNMRGFYQNVRNGNSFAVVNSELRWPIFSYLFQKPIRSDFIKNFQVVGFGDIGTAWNGLTPYSEENAINTRTIDRRNVVIVLDSQKDPIVYSYGFGLRTRLFGYFLRFDWGWPIEDGVVLDNQFMFSIGTDF